MAHKEMGPRQVQLIATALAMNDVFLGGLLVFFATQGDMVPLLDIDAEQANLYAAVCVGLGISSLLVSFAVKQLMMRSKPTQQGRKIAVIAALAITDGAGILGFLLGLLTGMLIPAFVLIGLSGGIKVFHWPTRAFLERESGSAPGAGL